jgi:hypothetical protein
MMFDESAENKVRQQEDQRDLQNPTLSIGYTNVLTLFTKENSYSAENAHELRVANSLPRSYSSLLYASDREILI